jgi:predicted DCC family thiol-disulfide oxidoreductase YuxK
MGRATVLYDGGCGFCRFSAERLRAWDRRNHLAFDTIQGAEGDLWLGDLEPATRVASWHLVTPDGRVWSAGAAVPELLRRLPAGRSLAALFAAFPGTTDRMYAWVARHRTRFGTLLGREACAVDPSRHRED